MCQVYVSLDWEIHFSVIGLLDVSTHRPKEVLLMTPCC